MANLRRLAVARELVDRLSDRGIRAIVLKGATLAQDAFGDVGARDDRDLDLLVPETQLPAVIEILSAQNLTFVENPRPSAITREILQDPVRRRRFAEADFAGAGITVDVHWRLFRNRHLLPLRHVAPRELPAGGTTIPALRMPEAFFYAMVHGTEHGWFRLKWIADVAGLIRHSPGLIAVGTLDQGQQIGVERCVATGLLMAERVLGPFLTEEARNWAQSVPGTGTMVRISARWLSVDDEVFLDPHRSPRDGLDEARLALSMRSDRGYRQDEAAWLLVRAGRLQRREGAAPAGARALALAPLSYLGRLGRRAMGRRVSS
jgi:hypothetical protein